jgi:hypothetical protein
MSLQIGCFLIPFEANARDIRNVKRSVTDFIGLLEDRIGPVLPFHPMRGFRDAHHVSGHLRVASHGLWERPTPISNPLGGGLLRRPRLKGTYYFDLAIAAHVAVTRKGCKHALVPQILGPSLVLLWCPAKLAAKEGKGFSETVRIEVWQAGQQERILEYFSNWTGTAPMLAVQSHDLELTPMTDGDLGGRKKRIA